MSGVDFVSDLKVRAGWGQTGNQEIGDFNAYSTYQSNPNSSGYGLGSSPIGYMQGFDLGRFGNPNAAYEFDVIGICPKDLPLNNFTYSLWVRPMEFLRNAQPGIFFCGSDFG